MNASGPAPEDGPLGSRVPQTKSAARVERLRALTNAETVSLCVSAAALLVSFVGLWFQVRVDDDLQISIASVQRSDRTVQVHLAAVNQGNRKGVLLSAQPWLASVEGASYSSVGVQLRPNLPMVVDGGSLSTLDLELPTEWPGLGAEVAGNAPTHRLILCLRVMDSHGAVYSAPIPVASMNFRSGRIFVVDYFTGSKRAYVNPDHGSVSYSYAAPATTRTSSASDLAMEDCISTAAMNGLKY